jgi:hypothetical protein
VRKSDAEIVISGTPISMQRILKVDIPIIDIDYTFVEREGNLEKIISRI